MKSTILILFILNAIFGFSQTRIYTGFIDKYPIQLATYSYSGGDIRAVYAYDKFDTPIIINGKLTNDTLILVETDDKGVKTARFEFTKVDEDKLVGKWTSENEQNQFDIILTKTIEFDSYDTTAFFNLELIQSESTSDHYFKLLLSKEAKKSIFVTGVRIYEKKTDILIQELQLECYLMNLNNISIGDYNFDGIEDFSVFEASYAGPNTTSIYILRIPNSKEYFISDFSGTSLGFDSSEKIIYEHNQCCAGQSHMNATYKVVNNKMVLIKKSCIEYDEEKEDFIDVKCE